MLGFNLSAHNLRKQKLENWPLYNLAAMLLFWGIFDGILSYVTPLAVTEAGFSKTAMGLILGISSVSGAVFDFALCRFLGSTNFRRTFLAMFALCSIYPLVLWSAKGFWLYVFAMALWGIYYDLRNFGNFDFVGRYTRQEEHSASFGLVQVFQSLGYMVAPLLAGALVVNSVGSKPFLFAWIFLGIAFCFYLSLMSLTNRKKYWASETRKNRPKGTAYEFRVWWKIISLALPVLSLTFFLSLFDSYFWIIGPLFAKSLSGSFHQFEGILMTAYQLPWIMVGWFVGRLTLRYGKKRTAFAALFCGSAILSLISFAPGPYAVLLVIFLASAFVALAWPAANGTYADYIAEAPGIEKEIEGVEDFFINFGYVVGPVSAGFLADIFGIAAAFTVLGVVGMLVAGTLFFVAPRSIDVRPLQKVR